MEIDIKYKIDLDGFAEQDFPWQCPESECNTEMETKDILLVSEYSKNWVKERMVYYPMENINSLKD